jgi:hypothetical protein
MRTVLVVALCAACGGPGERPGENFDEVVRACVVMNACNGVDLDTCALQFIPNMTAAQVSCVIDAGGDCAAANACIGYSLVQDSSCSTGCIDGDTLQRCTAGFRTTIECAIYPEDVGPSCVTAQAPGGGMRFDCGGATCSASGSKTCAGTVSTVCDSGITEVIDCAVTGLECSTGTRRCVGQAGPSCIEGSTAVCNGTKVVECVDGIERSTDCGKIVAGMTCVNGASGPACGFANECSGGSTCSNNTLNACIAGRVVQQDCIALGFTTCSGGLGRCM